MSRRDKFVIPVRNPNTGKCRCRKHRIIGNDTDYFIFNTLNLNFLANRFTSRKTDSCQTFFNYSDFFPLSSILTIKRCPIDKTVLIHFKIIAPDKWHIYSLQLIIHISSRRLIIIIRNHFISFQCRKKLLHFHGINSSDILSLHIVKLRTAYRHNSIAI